MEHAKGLILFSDIKYHETHMGILFENGWCLCLCCGGWLKPDEFDIVEDYEGFAYVEELLMEGMR